MRFKLKPIGSFFLLLLFIFSSGCSVKADNVDEQPTPLDGRGGGIIAFASDRDGGDHDIFVMNADGSGMVQLTNNSFSYFSPDWSPDGGQIAFESDQVDL